MPPEPPPKITSTTGQPSWMAPVMPVVPDHELLRRIGGGSYGDVWLACTTVGTWRAVKVVFRDRFTDARPYDREFHGIQKFEPLSRGNEAFIDILQIGRNDAEGYFYYVMELADDAVSPVFQPAGPGPSAADGTVGLTCNAGFPTVAGADSPTGKSALQPSTYVPKTLAKVLFQRGRLPLGECLELGLTLNLGLAHLHRAGLIHRDIKPSNIIFVGGVPKLADIGLVVETAEARSYVGTEGFIPPEGPNSPQADLYSLGKVLYEAGMGKDRKDFPEPYTQIAEAPDSAQLLEFNAILLKACAANVTERYQSAEEMNADLALLQSGGSVRRQRKLAGQLRFVQRAGAVVAVLAAVIALGWWWQAKQTQVVRELAAQKAQLAEEKTKLAEEKRQRIVRLDIANGVRLLDEGDPSAALLWFADALPLVTNKPSEEAIHRIRIQQTVQQTPRLLVAIGCSNSVSAGAWSPDGRRFALATYGLREGKPDWWVQLHDGADGQVTWTAELGLTSWIGQLRFSRDGSRLLVSSPSVQGQVVYGTGASVPFAVALDADTGRKVFPGFASNMVWAAFSPDDRWLALADSNHVIHIANAQDGTPAVELIGHTDKIKVLSFSADGSWLASASEDRSVRLWRLPSGEPVGVPLPHNQPLQRVVLSDDGLRALTATKPSGTNKECTIQLWETQTSNHTGTSRRETNNVFALAFTPGAGDRFILGADRAEVEVRDSQSGEPVCQPLNMTSVARCWDFSPDGDLLAVGSDDGMARIWRVATGELLFPPFRHTGWVESVHFSPDGKQLLTTSNDGTAKVWSLAQQSETARLTLSANFPDQPGAEAYRPRGRTPGPITIGLEDRFLHLIDPNPLTEATILKPQEPGTSVGGWQAGSTGRFWAVVEAINFNNDDSTCTVTLWQREGTSYRHRSLPHPKIVPFAMFTPDDSRLITFCRDWSVRIWRTSDGELERTIPVPQSYAYLPPILGVNCFSPDAGGCWWLMETRTESCSSSI